MMKPMVYLFCDESFQRNHPDKKTILGIVAGYMVPDFYLEEFRSQLQEIYKKYQSETASDKKLHMAELPEPLRSSMQQDVFHILSHKNVICLYDAINTVKYKQFRTQHLNLKTAVQQLKHRKIFIDKIVTSKPDEEVNYELFKALMLKGIDYGNQYLPEKPFHLEVVPDRIDGRTGNYEKVLQRIESPGIWSEYHVNSAADKMPNAYEITVKSTPTMKSFTLKLAHSNSAFIPEILCADVLANTLFHHLPSRDDNFNTHDAVSEHPLLSKLYFHHCNMSDILYNNGEKNED